MKKRCIFLVISVFISSQIWADGRAEISLDKVLRLTEINSPKMSASRFQELAAKKSVVIAKSAYYPTLSFEAIDSTGFPGSSAGMGVIGLMDSPYRSGISGGLVAQQIVYDFGRTFHDVQAAKHEVELSRQDTRVTLLQVKQLALQTYYECSFYRTQRDTWNFLEHESGLITKEAQHFVNTGQVSIVDRYLSQIQTEDARTAKAFYTTRLDESVRELAVIMGICDTSFTCPPLPHSLTPALKPFVDALCSPLLTRAVASAKVAEERLKQQKAGFYPKIVAIGSAGGMERVRLLDKHEAATKNYAAGIGVILPIIDLHTTGEIQRAKAIVCSRAQEVQAEKQRLDELNTKYDEIIRSAQVKLKHLNFESTIAEQGFKTAKDRYFAFEGPLLDLRDAFNNLTRIKTEINETQAQYLQASGSKALLNGGAG